MGSCLTKNTMDTKDSNDSNDSMDTKDSNDSMDTKDPQDTKDSIKPISNDLCNDCETNIKHYGSLCKKCYMRYFG